MLDRYIECLISDLRQQVEHFDLSQATLASVFFGGGTPSLFSAEQLSRLLEQLPHQFAHIEHDLEVTLEANPGSLEHQSLPSYVDAGINRLSLGAQSFNDRHLQQLGRIHQSNHIHQSLEEACIAGFKHINVDLMYALPSQTLLEARTDLQAALSYDIDHLSYYQLTIEKNTPFERNPPKHLPDDDLALDIKAQADELLHAQGFCQYEISAWQKSSTGSSSLNNPNDLSNACRHNLNYWRFGDYVGIGAGAHGKISTHHSVNGYVNHCSDSDTVDMATADEWVIWRTRHAQSPQRYINDIAQGKLPLKHSVSANDLPIEFALNQLRLQESFTLDHYQRCTHLPRQSIHQALQKARQQKLLNYALPLTSTCPIRVTALGKRYLNDLQAIFM